MKRGPIAALLLTAIAGWSQTGNTDIASDAREQMELQRATAEAGTSAIDLIHALENHLKKYPDSRERADIENAIARAAMDANDNERVVAYGERVLARETPPDTRGDIPPLLDRVIRALVDKEDQEQAKRAVTYALRYEADIAEARNLPSPPGHLTPALWAEELDKGTARALALEARARRPGGLCGSGVNRRQSSITLTPLPSRTHATPPRIAPAIAPTCAPFI